MTASPDYFFLDGQKLVATDNGDGTKTLVVSSTGGGGGAGAAGTPVLDNAGVRWLWIYDATAGTSTYISFVTGSAGTPTFPLTPDADTSVQVSNFPATQPVSAASLPLPTGAATEATLSAQNAKMPALVAGRTPVDGSGVTQPVSGTFWQATQPVSGPLTDTQLRATAVPISATALPLPTGAATETTLSALNTKIPSQATPGLIPVDTLGTPGAARVQATSGTAASIALTTTCRRISMYATQGTWYAITGTATATSHYVASGERIDLDVPASTTVSVLQETTAGSIRITELV